jgi:hypothetical protein
MTKKVRIIATPAGFAPRHIREQWVGVEIPLIDQEEADALQDSLSWNSDGQYGGSIVRTCDAITALRDAGKEDAARFWEMAQAQLGTELRFGTEYCELV